jgi:hypothetical protein
MTTLADLHAELDEMQQWGLDPRYYAKMIHHVPVFPILDREPYIVARCAGLRVLDIGCASGTLHRQIQESAAWVTGVDHEPCGHPGDIWLDLDDYVALQAWQVPSVDLIVMAEVIEHLCNPGYLLKKLRVEAPSVPLLITTPNAMATAGQVWMQRGIECVNPDHNAWYSYHTLQVLLQKCGWPPDGCSWSWYGGGPAGLNEGIICVAREDARHSCRAS